MCSLPRRRPRTKPASRCTCRCFVMAWRDTADSSANCTIDSGPRVDSRSRSARRVSSPSAAKRGAAVRARAAAALAFDMAADVLHLAGPALAVHAQGRIATARRQAVEARLDDGEPRALAHRLQPELHERGGFGRIVDLG